MDKQTKEWKNFIIWREKEIDKIQKSREMKNLKKQFSETMVKISELSKPKFIKTKFLWWEHEEIDFLQWGQDNIESNFLISIIDGLLLKQKLLLAKIPEETYEGFLNWKAGKYD